jgi:acetolactate synthase-1/2/3 large subunit
MEEDIVTFSGSIVKPHKPGGWMDPGPLGTLGVGTGFALASKLVQPERDVVVLFGDGALGLTAFNFELMVRYNLPFVGVVGNNSSWNQIRYGQTVKYGKERGDIGNVVGDVRFDKFAEALGGFGIRVTKPEDIRPALDKARNSGKPALVEVLSRSIDFKGRIAQALLKKVWPLIDQGKIKPVIYKTFHLDDAASAHRFMESSEHICKIVLKT